MSNDLLVASLLFSGLFGVPGTAAIPPSQCAAGVNTVLLVGGVAREPRHDGKDGEAKFTLEDKATRSVLWQKSYPGEAVCLGYDAASKTYLVGVKKQQGIGVRMTSLYYIDEKLHTARISAFNKRNMEAFAAVPSPSLRFVALIAMEGNDISLFVLDTETNVVSTIGKAPLPPPFSATERQYAKQHADLFKDDPWDWMSSLRDGYMPLDPGIIRFEGDGLLAVSYGSDSSDERSKARRVVKFDMAKLH